MIFDIPRPADPPKNPPVEITSKQYKHSIVDSKKTPIETLVAYIGGSNWQVDYYSQIFGPSEELKAFDPNQLNPYQNYHKINRLILKLQGSISQEDEKGTGRFEMRGSAIITPHPNLAPNVGDAFIADVGEGEAGQFTVVSVRKLTNNLSSAWSIEFTHDRLLTEKIAKLLDSKVTQESYYQRDYLITGQNAIMASEDYVSSEKLKRHLKQISQQLISNNFSFSTHTLTVPLQELPTYDPFITRAVLKTISQEDTALVRDIREYNCDDHRIPKVQDIYTAVIKRDPTLLYNTFTGFAKISTTLLTASVYQNSVRYSGVKYIIAPYRVQKGAGDNYQLLNEMISGYRISSTVGGLNLEYNAEHDACGCPIQEVEDAVDELKDLGNIGLNIPKIGNDTYVLSKAFYDEDLVNCSLFEQCVWDILRQRPSDVKSIYAFCENYHKWGLLEQFYLGPLLILLIRNALRGL